MFLLLLRKTIIIIFKKKKKKDFLPLIFFGLTYKLSNEANIGSAQFYLPDKLINLVSSNSAHRN